MTATLSRPPMGARVPKVSAPWTPSELQRALAKSVVQQLAAERGINPIVASGAGRDPSHMAFRDAVIAECKRVLNIGNDKLAIVLGRDVGTIKKALRRAGVAS
jgi:hypothetical protein